MKLIVGLGNPGNEYAKTRHNVGFMVIDALAKELNVNVDQKKFKSLIAKTTIKNEGVILMKPQTYMNLSGEAIISAAQFFQIDPSDILVIYDDMDLPTGKVRLREKGSAGGHNGIKNMIQHLHTQEFPRIRIGIGKHQHMDTKDFVLGKISKEEMQEIEKSIETSVKACLDFPKYTFMDVMNRHNKKDTPKKKTQE